VSDITTRYIAAADSDSALAIAWAERMTARPDSPSVALHADDISPRIKDQYGHVFRTRVGVDWRDGMPVIVNDVTEVEL
jgi:hypothetical protein